MASVADKLPGKSSPPESRAIPWITMGWFLALLIAANFPILKHLVEQWWSDDDMTHGFVVPLVSVYIAWQHREKLLALDCKPAWWGLAVMGWGVLQGYLGWISADLFLQ